MNDAIPPSIEPTNPPAAAAPSRNRPLAVAIGALVVVAIAAAAFLATRGPADPGPVGATTATASLAPSASPAASEPGASIVPTAGPSSPAASIAPAPGQTQAPPPADAPRLGSADAPVVIDYWADYQCPFCAAFASDVIPQLQPLIDDGTVAVVHRDFAFLGPESLEAAKAARCAGDDYWAMHDALYAAQVGENQGGFARPALAEIGTSIGLHADDLAVCLDERATTIQVLDDTAAGIRAAVDSTPTIDVNGTRFTTVPTIEELTAVIDAAAAGAPPALLPARAPIQDPWAALDIDGRAVGDPAAPVTVDLWVDYQGVSGPVLARELAPELRSRVAAGDIRVVLHDLALLGAESVVASSTVRCVEEQGGPAWLVHDVLSAAGSGPDNLIFVPDPLLHLASQLGLDVKAFDNCMQDPAIAAMIEEDTQAGRSMRLRSGPAVVISTDGQEAARFEGTLVAASVLAAIDEAIP